MKTTAILDSYWVIPGKFLAGEYPGALDSDEAREKLRWLIEQGVSEWIDLTEDREHGLRPYKHLLLEEAARCGKTVNHTRLPIPDFSTTTPEHMKHILSELDKLLDEGKTIYLHCYGGIGRTGMTVGCFLVGHGWENKLALKQISEWRKKIPSGRRASPETVDQVQFVLDWGQGERTQRNPIFGEPSSGFEP